MHPESANSSPRRKRPMSDISVPGVVTRIRGVGQNFSALFVFIALFSIWDLACRIGDVPEWLLPAPSRIAEELWIQRALMPPHLLTTAYEVVLGFAVARSEERRVGREGRAASSPAWCRA